MKDKSQIVRYIFTILHFIASFVYERKVLIFGADNSIVAAIARNNSYSDKAEQTVAYLLSKLFAAIFIFLLWKLIFYVFEHIKADRTVLVSLVIFTIGIPLLLTVWPNIFEYSSDNLITYSYAIRFFPEYWHNAYSSIIYCACLMTIPHPFSICVFQWMLAIFDFAYLAERLKTNKKWLVFLLIIIPESWILFTDAYRTEQYALVCLFYSSLIVADIIEKKKRPAGQIFCLLILSAFIAVWRSEGIILGGCGAIVLSIYNRESLQPAWKKFKHIHIKKTAMISIFIYFFVFSAAFLLIRYPQTLGNEKYYGDDYSLINSFPSLRNILNSKDANLSYPEAENDIKAIDSVVPVGEIQLYGLIGYRSYNYYQGHKDINQSLASDEESSAYKKAYYRIIMHNPIIYIKAQLGMLKKAIRLTDRDYIQGVEVWRVADNDNLTYYWEYDAWDKGAEDLNSYCGVKAWRDNSLRKTISDFILKLKSDIISFCEKMYISSSVIILIVCFEIFIIIREFVLMIRRHGSLILVYALILLATAAGITMVMPDGVLGYFHAFLFSTAALEILYVDKMLHEHKQKKYRTNKIIGKGD